MRVLHLPYNIASQISVTVRALRDIGVDARGLVLNGLALQDADAVENYSLSLPWHHHPILSLRQSIKWLDAFRAAVRWADVVHWHYTVTNFPRDLDLRYIALLKKPRLVQFWGTEIRDPVQAGRDNPYLRNLLTVENNYSISSRTSRATQKRFSKSGFECLIPGPEMFDYLHPDLFPSPFRTEASLLLSEFEPLYPDPRNRRPLVVHIPSRPEVKGTGHVLSAVERLSKRMDFEFRLIQQMPHREVLAVMRESDIVLDQFIIGSYGTVALEAMALGKPVLCYIKPSLYARLPTGIPVVNANPDNLEGILEMQLKDGQLRAETGRLGRRYVEQHHDAHQIARQLERIYRGLLEKKIPSRS
jgi:glycosyltransferase involved in cell wall biosynthesis